MVGRKVTFGEAIAVAGTGTFLVGAVVVFVQGIFGLLIGLLIFLLLVKHYFKTGWLGAIGVAVMAIVVLVVHGDSCSRGSHIHSGGRIGRHALRVPEDLLDERRIRESPGTNEKWKRPLRSPFYGYLGNLRPGRTRARLPRRSYLPARKNSHRCRTWLPRLGLFGDLNTTPDRFKHLVAMSFQPSIKCLHRFIVAFD